MFSVQEILKITGGRILPEKPKGNFKGISTDTRKIKPGELFIPLKGPNYDGRKFFKQALKQGAYVLDVKDGLKALQDLAAYHRKKFKIHLIGITGSSGKTTVKDMLASILSQKMKTLKNEENLNNEIGVPLTLLKLKKTQGAAVIEMAMQGLKEIELLARLARPTISVVTNIGEAHIEFLKNKKNVARAKSEIFKYLKKGDHAVINQDDEYFEHLRKSIPSGVRVKTFGILNNADLGPKQLKGIKLPLPGEHNIYNALCALAVSKILKINKQAIKKGLEAFIPSKNRMEIFVRRDNIKVINDTYNANPQSMAAALKVLAINKGRKIAVLGDMLELGSRSKQAHAGIGSLARQLKIDRLFSVGKLSKELKAERHFRDAEEAKKHIKKLLRPGDTVLCKASRALRLEKVVDSLRI